MKSKAKTIIYEYDRELILIDGRIIGSITGGGQGGFVLRVAGKEGRGYVLIRDMDRFVRKCIRECVQWIPEGPALQAASITVQNSVVDPE